MPYGASWWRGSRDRTTTGLELARLEALQAAHWAAAISGADTIGDELLKTVERTGTGEVRKKNAAGTGPRA